MTTTTLECLHRSRELVQPALRAAVERLDPTSRAVTSYHLGWTDADGTPAEGDGGKAVRPTLALLSAEVVGADAEVAAPGAVAVELVHNFSLLHDDLMDRDRLRRHRPTVWTVWDPATAILAGDALSALSVQVLLDPPRPNGDRAAALVARTTQQLIRGQVADLAFEHRPSVGPEECLRMAGDKTGALLSASASIGALLAGAPGATVEALARFGFELGLAFQLVDDLLGIWGDPATTGKPVFSDLRAGKKTLPITFAASRGGPHGGPLAAWLASGRGAEDGELHHLAALVEAAGGRAWALAEAGRRVAACRQVLADAGLGGPAARELLDLATFTVTRDL